MKNQSNDVKNIEKSNKQYSKIWKNRKRFSMPDRRKAISKN